MTEFDFSLRTVGKEGQKGRYSQSFHWDVKHFGSKRWVVLGYLDVDWPRLEEENKLSKSEIVDLCLEQLNKAPERKKYQKRVPKPLYGTLERYKEKFVDGEQPYIIYEFVTDDPKNKLFLGEPPKHSLSYSE